MNGKFNVLLCILACCFYASEIVLAERKLGKVAPITSTFLMGIAAAIFALPGFLQGVQNGSIVIPRWEQIFAIACIAFLAFLADWCHFVILNRGAGSVTLATFYLLIPVICSLMKWELPSVKMVVAWILGGIALLLVSSDLGDKPLP